MIPAAYPSFQPLEMSHKPLIDELLRQHPPEISEFTFTNLYAWRKTYDFSVASLAEYLIVCSQSSGVKKFLYPLGSGDIKEVMRRIIDETDGTFIRVPESIASLCEHDAALRIDLDADNSDYVYKTRDLVELTGRRYDGKRNLIRNFKAHYRYQYASLDKNDIQQCLDFAEYWCVIKDCDSVKGMVDEKQALREMAAHFSDLNLAGGAIKVEGEMRAIALAERLNPSTMVVHILKARPDAEGLYQTILNEFLAHEGVGFEYVNLEQDLGVEGLRKSKQSYHPVRMVNKYTVASVSRK